ncbi:hypothetical protein [Paraburkholderia sp. UCT2]|uniref:hypothetical protein n=1 Tax=Paraburkholderia sp. UCT2 TaxID=2615208 RepID=UPI001655E229|nr:hypothetical protein [Paraburkholderia sp. UCT2]
MLNLLVVDLGRFGHAWGERLAAEIEATRFINLVDRVWFERRGITGKACVAFHLDIDVDRMLLSGRSNAPNSARRSRPMIR